MSAENNSDLDYKIGADIGARTTIRNDTVRMLPTTQNRLSQTPTRPQSRFFLTRHRTSTALKNRSGISCAYAVQSLSVIGLAALFISTLFCSLPDNNEYDDYGILQRTIVRQKIEALKGVPHHKGLAGTFGTGQRTRRRLQEGHRRRKTAHRIHGIASLGQIRAEKVQLGTFKNAWRVGFAEIAIHQEKINRFDVPWLLLPRVKTVSLVESGYRLLYSPIKEKASGGIGHGLTVLNAELSTALTLGFAYTHRVGIYGSISRRRPMAIEDLFGWGSEEVPRKFIEQEVCDVVPISHKDPPGYGSESCPVCTSIRKDSALEVSRIVEVPSSFSYGCISCHETRNAVTEFLHKHNKNHTLFHMSPAKCDSSPKSPDFSLSHGFFYWKYWDLHGSQMFSVRPSLATKQEGKKWTLPLTQRGPVALVEEELNIVIHARRGDFFTQTKRRMVSARVLASVANASTKIVQKVGGAFSELPVAIILFSEGRERNGTVSELHEQSALSKEFVDIDGKVRDARWVHRLFMPNEAHITGNATHTTPMAGDLFPSGLRIEMRISTDVVQAVHEMAAADVFIGSASDLSQYAVRIVSRAGMQILPDYQGAMGACCAARFDVISGTITQKTRLEEYWRLYTIANEASAIRATKHERDVND